MRVLHLTPELPYAPGGSGGSTRQFALLRGLVERGHQVSVVAPVHASQRAGAGALRAAGVELHAVARPASRVRETLDALGRRPALALAPVTEPVLAWQVDVFWTALRPLVRRLLAVRDFDVAIVEHDWAAAWHRALPAELPRVLTLQNASWAYYASRARATGGPARLALAAESRRFRAFDARHLPAYDRLVAMSQDDRRAISSLVDVPCDVVPNGVDTRALTPAPPPASGDPLLLFTGTLSYPPNAEAVLWLLGDIWPRIRARVPRARLRIVGPDPPAAARALADDRTEFTGWVESVAEHFAAATAVAVPIRSGGGTRLKVLDALSAGRAIVATTAGAEGIDAAPGEHLLRADSVEAFAAAAARLLEDGPLRERLAAAGRRLAEEAYDWRSLAGRLEAVLDSARTRA